MAGDAREEGHVEEGPDHAAGAAGDGEALARHDRAGARAPHRRPVRLLHAARRCLPHAHQLRGTSPRLVFDLVCSLQDLSALLSTWRFLLGSGADEVLTWGGPVPLSVERVRKRGL
eukprot:1277725-Rhodomonas_salina.1